MVDAPHVQPPPIPPWFVPRPRLIARLDTVLQHRLTTVVAGPGYGKSTILAAWGLSMGCAWLSAGPRDASVSTFAEDLVSALRHRLPVLRSDLAAVRAGGEGDDAARAELLAGLISESLEPILPARPPGLPLIIDAAEHLGRDRGSFRLVEALIRQGPPGLHLVLVSREEPPESLRRVQEDALALGPSDLALSIQETEAMVVSTVGPIDRDALEVLQSRTAGWPAAVRLAVERIQNAPETLRHQEAFGDSFAALADQVLSREPPEVLDLLSLMSPFERFTADLCEALGVADARALLDSLAGRGLFVQYQAGAERWLTVHALLREFARGRRPRGPDETRATLLAAGEWFAERSHLEDALNALEAAGDHTHLARFLTRHGPGLLEAGAGGRLLSAGALIPAEMCGPDLELLLGSASRLRGDWVAAGDHYRRAAGDLELIPAPLAWRLAEAHYVMGDLSDTIEVAVRADRSGASDHDRAMLLAWEASARHRLGDHEEAATLARSAREIAEREGDDEALAAAHTAEAMVALLVGRDDAAREAHELTAIQASERAQNPWARVRILVNRADHLVNQGRFDEVNELTDTAMRVAETSGDPYTAARVLDTRAEAAFGQGRMAEAANDAQAARVLYDRVRSQMGLAAALLLGRVHRETGRVAAARAVYTEAVRAGEESGEPSVIQEALAGLARVTAREDPGEAIRLVNRARAIAGGTQHSRSQALLAAGWVTLATGDRAGARELAEEAARAPIVLRRRPRLAEAIELAAMSAPEPDVAMLERALELWREIGNAVGTARVDFALATLNPGSRSGRPSLGAAARRLQGLGVHPSAARTVAGLLGTLPETDVPPLEIRTLGGFAVLRRGEPVPFAEWRSKKARDLLKILVARRGLPTHREYLMEALWPEEPPGKTSNRLSVALTILRTVLDPDRTHDPHHFVTGEGESIRLNLDRTIIDVEGFLARGRDALRGDLAGQEALLELEASEALYHGDFLEEDPYEDWATNLREEAKSVYVEVCRALALASLRSGRHEDGVDYGLKLLSRDRYDEVAHLLMVRALAASGRHGEARRRYRMYVAALEEIGVDPSPYPGTSPA